MPTKIDTLITELVLDPTKFSAGQRKVVQDLRKLEDETRKRGGDIEKRIENSVQKILQLHNRVLGVVAGFLGGRTLKNFLGDLTAVDAQVGRTAHNFGGTVRQVSTFAKAVELAGGSATEGADAFANYTTTILNYRTSGAGADVINLLSRLSNAAGVVIDITKPFGEQFEHVQDAVAKVADLRGRTEAFFYAQRLGFGPGMANLVAQGTTKLREYRTAAANVGLTTDESAAAAQRYQTSLTTLASSIDNLGRSATPLIEWFSSVISRGSEALGLVTGMLSWDPKTEKAVPVGTPTSKTRRGPAPAGAAAPPTPAPGGVRHGATGPGVKSNAGEQSLATAALSAWVSANVPGVEQFTAFNDPYHAFYGTGGHPKGLALDFTLKDKEQSAQISGALRAKLAEMGVQATVLDEYLHPSKHSTGPHIHVGFGNAAAAERFRELSGASRPTGAVTNRTSSVVVQKIEVHTAATDAAGIARDIGPAIQRASYAFMANGLVA